MHIAEAADSSESTVQEWEGITGRMKQLLEMQDRRVELALDSKLAEITRQLGAMDSNFAELKSLFQASHH